MRLGLLLAARGLVLSPDAGTVAYGPVTDFFNRVELGYVGGVGYQPTHGHGLGLRSALRNNVYGALPRTSAFQLYVGCQIGKWGSPYCPLTYLHAASPAG